MTSFSKVNSRRRLREAFRIVKATPGVISDFGTAGVGALLAPSLSRVFCPRLCRFFPFMSSDFRGRPTPRRCEPDDAETDDDRYQSWRAPPMERKFRPTPS